jgi:hypothetical protein
MTRGVSSIEIPSLAPDKSKLLPVGSLGIIIKGYLHFNSQYFKNAPNAKTACRTILKQKIKLSS